MFKIWLKFKLSIYSWDVFLFMRAFRGFILGFSLSLVSVSLTGHLLSSSTLHGTSFTKGADIRIDLFKKDTSPLVHNVFANIQKHSLLPPASDAFSSKEVPISEINLASSSINSTTNTSVPPDVVYAPENIEGSEDDEILNVNIDEQIPIDFNTEVPHQNAVISQSDTDNNKIALLPSQITPDTNNDVFASPWVVAKGSKHIKNKKLLEDYAKQNPQDALSDTPKQLASGEEGLSYKVAERIKQSIIFPIPDEILNDENLTPTFIAPQKKNISTSKTSKKTEAKPSSLNQTNKAETLKIISKVEPSKNEPPLQSNTESRGLLSNISSWFSTDNKGSSSQQKPDSKRKSVPSYSSQGEQVNVSDKSSSLSSNDALVSFYETIQETQKEQAKNKIIPSELKLYFQPERAEISGQTLRWLKAFAEKAKETYTYLQIRLDATAPIDLQRKRLNLLYTVLMNNGVDFKKVDTVFSLTEPNTFIIRTIKVQEQNFQ